MPHIRSSNFFIINSLIISIEELKNFLISNFTICYQFIQFCNKKEYKIALFRHVEIISKFSNYSHEWIFPCKIYALWIIKISHKFKFINVRIISHQISAWGLSQNYNGLVYVLWFEFEYMSPVAFIKNSSALKYRIKNFRSRYRHKNFCTSTRYYIFCYYSKYLWRLKFLNWQKK